MDQNERAPLILVPGLDGTGLLFYRQIPLLAPRFRVASFPLPEDSDCTMETLVATLGERIEQVAASEQVFLCGESFGGALSLSFGLSRPERLRGLVIINSFPVIRRRWGLRLGLFLLRCLPWSTVQIVRRLNRHRLHSPGTLRQDLEAFHRNARAIGKRGYTRRLEILRDYDIRDRLQQIPVPTLFLAADRDRVVPSVEEAFAMAARMPRATVKVLSGYGHVCLIHHRLNLREHIEPWLEGLPTPR